MFYKSCIFAIILLANACSRNPVFDGNLEHTVVYSVLSPAYEVQTVYLDSGINAADFEGTLAPGLQNPVSGAEVQISTSSGTASFDEVAPGIYQNISQPLELNYGETYHLLVVAPNGRETTARTTIPDSIRFISPQQGASFAERETVHFAWLPGRRAAIFLFGEVIPECSGFQGDKGAFNLLSFGHEPQTAIWFLPWPNCDPDKSAIMNLRVLAPDTAAAAFIWPGQARIDGQTDRSSNIQGGAGVFGSMVMDSIKIQILP